MTDPLDTVTFAAEAATEAVVKTALALAEAEAAHNAAVLKAARLTAALAALRGEAPVAPISPEGQRKIEAAPPPMPVAPAPQGGICMACEAPQVFPVTRTMRGTPITIRQCQACGCDNL